MRKVTLILAVAGALLATACLAEDAAPAPTPSTAAPVSQAVKVIDRQAVFTPRVAADRTWRGLTGGQILALNRALATLDPVTVNIFCGGTYCQRLAEDLDETFQSAGNDSYLQVPMFDIGVGIAISPDNDETRAIAATLAKISHGRVDLKVFPAGKKPAEAITIAIGRVPRPTK